MHCNVTSLVTFGIHINGGECDIDSDCAKRKLQFGGVFFALCGQRHGVLSSVWARSVILLGFRFKDAF